MYKPKAKVAISFSLSIIIILSASLYFICSQIFLPGIKLDLNYYIVYKYTSDNVVSALSLADAAEASGGAGYYLNYNNKYYVAISCYYDQSSANSVCFNLKTKGAECEILTINLSQKKLSLSDISNCALFSGNINTLEQLGKIVFSCANLLDKGECTQSSARKIIADARSTIKYLSSANACNAFSPYLSDLLTLCDELLQDDYIYSKYARKLQIAIIDAIISVDLT